MKRNLRYLEWIPFAICFGALIIYIVYTINIKVNPAIIVTNKLVNTMKTYLIIALVSLFIGLLIVLIKKIYKLVKTEEKVIYRETKTVTVENTEPIEEEKIVVNTSPIINDRVKAEEIKEEKIVVKTEPVVKEEKITEKVVYKQEKKYDDIICYECGKIISNHAAICPNCGVIFDDEVIRVLKKYDKQKNRFRPVKKIVNLVIILIFIILIIIMSNVLYNKYKSNLRNITSTITQRR